MNMEELFKTVSEAYLNPGEGEADRNGNTRLAVLQERFHLSSLKLQKILVTAGVYRPVKSNTSFDEITRLRKEGKNIREIMEILGVSSATVSACFPYERSVYNSDQNGANISSDAERKRKQRNNEEAKRMNAIDMLHDKMTDESFWKAIMEHDRETFISTDGERYSICAQTDGHGKVKTFPGYGQEIYVNTEKDGTKSFRKEEVLDVFHNALELKACDFNTEVASFDQCPSLPYVYPILVFFGIIPGDKTKYTVRRAVPESYICSCCGRLADYTVSSYADLVWTAKEIEEEERSRWDKKERERVERMENSYGRVSWDEIAKKDNAAIQAFNGEGERHFCTLCAQTIRMALEDGELPHSSAPVDFSDLSMEAAEAGFYQYLEMLPKDVWFEDRLGRKFDADMVGDDYESKIFLYKEKDKDGHEHFFACYAQDLSDHMIFEAMEIHRLTKAGNFARDYTGTDYEFRTGLKLMEEDDEDENLRKTYIGFLELVNKIREALKNPSLEWYKERAFISNAVHLGNRCCTMRSTGEMRVVSVNEISVQGRDWQGGDYGYLIDGIIFSGEEVALMSSVHEGWNLQYRFTDPSDEPLREGEYLMPVMISEKGLVDETSELLNLFTKDGAFISSHDEENFDILFEKTVMRKLKLYHESNPRGYGRLAGMQVIKRLGWITGTERQAEKVREMIGRL